MSMLKKFGVLVLILAMLVSIVAGCSSASTTTATSTSESSAGTNETTVAPTETEPGPVTIDIGMHVANPEEQESTTWQIIQAFKAKEPLINRDLSLLTGNSRQFFIKVSKIVAVSGLLSMNLVDLRPFSCGISAIWADLSLLRL